MSEHHQENTAASEQQQQQSEEDQLTLRALVSTREAGVIIGKGGKNVAELRDATGVKAGVSKVVQGVHDRVLTVSGTLEGVAMAYSLIARTMIDNPVAANTMESQDAPDSAGNAASATNTITTLRLLISHNLMGTVIGRQGAKIKHIQDNSGVRMTASKTLLPQSTERVVEVRGTVEAILQAISEIGACLIEDKDRAYGTILYNPTKVTTAVNDRRSSFTRTGNGSDFNQTDFSTSASSLSQPSRRTSYQPPAPHSQQPPLNADVRTQQISIPSDMVGCIIGKGGSKISEIRRLSGSHISIAKTPHDDSGERMFTIQGTMESNERALYLLYGQLENEKERRLQGVVLQQQQQQQQQDGVFLKQEEEEEE
ncbi:unnamed protein product [Mucor fragilis]